MTRHERRAAVSRTLNEVGILDTCQCLRMVCNGSADPWEPKAVAKATAFLRCVLATWEPDTDRRSRYDAAVRELVEATLAEVGPRPVPDSFAALSDAAGPSDGQKVNEYREQP